MVNDRVIQEEIVSIISELSRKESRRKIYNFYPDTGKLRRELYRPHIAFFKAGSWARERAVIAANAVGKTEGIGGYELTLHLTGDYPEWWEGKRFKSPINAWCSGDTTQTTRDILQYKLLGSPGMEGSGLIPGDFLSKRDIKKKAGSVPDAIESIRVSHVSGGKSRLVFKCHPAGERILTADYIWKNIEDVCLGDLIIKSDGTTDIVSQLHAYRKTEILEINTRAARIRVTPNHMIFLESGEKVAAESLSIGDKLEYVFNKDIIKKEEEGERQKDWLVAFTAVMIGDGCTRGRTPRITCNDPNMVQTLSKLLPEDLQIKKINGSIEHKVSSNIPNHNRLTESLRKDKLWGVLSKNKFIPDWVFKLPHEQKRDFIFWLWSCDGTINGRAASYCSSSERLAEDVSLLLMTQNIHACVKRYKQGHNTVDLTGINRIEFEKIGKFGKESKSTHNPKNLLLNEIISITKKKDVDVFAIGTESHEYICMGFRVGNSYDQRRQAFQGTEQHVILLDEEAPSDVYEECLMRTRTVGGIIMLTFTPLMGLTPLVLSFMPNGVLPVDGKVSPSKFAVNATWDDAPHLTEKEKEEILSGVMPHLKNARSRGIPQLGAGVVFPINLDEITIDDFQIPPWYPRAYALDVGWNWTAALWGAHDRESDILYLYSCHKQSHAEPETHVRAINGRGRWIPGVADPFGTTASNQRDGKKMIDEYRDLGLNLMLAERKMIETGIFKSWERMISGRLKIFKSLIPLFNELRTYHRNEEGKIAVGQDDHLIDDLRYIVTSGMDVMTIMPYEEEMEYIHDSLKSSKTEGAYFGKWY